MKSVRLLSWILLAPIGLYALLYVGQEGLIFHPRPLTEEGRAALNRLHPGAEVTIPAADGVSLHGWLRLPPGEGPHPVVIYFGGNAEEVSGMLADWERAGAWALLAVNYRGYGLSGGRPGEMELFHDALTLYDWLETQSTTRGTPRAAMGRSLGTGVAVHLAAERPLSGVILVSPYDSMAEVAWHHYPWVPTSLLLRHRFDSAARASDITAPALMLAARSDRIVPRERSEALARVWGGPRELAILEGAGHNSIHYHRDYWLTIAAFLNNILNAR